MFILSVEETVYGFFSFFFWETRQGCDELNTFFCLGFCFVFFWEGVGGEKKINGGSCKYVYHFIEACLA